MFLFSFVYFSSGFNDLKWLQREKVRKIKRNACKNRCSFLDLNERTEKKRGKEISMSVASWKKCEKGMRQLRVKVQFSEISNGFCLKEKVLVSYALEIDQ